MQPVECLVSVARRFGARPRLYGNRGDAVIHRDGISIAVEYGLLDLTIRGFALGSLGLRAHAVPRWVPPTRLQQTWLRRARPELLFDELYELRSNDQTFARTWISPEIAALLLRANDPSSWDRYELTIDDEEFHIRSMTLETDPGRLSLAVEAGLLLASRGRDLLRSWHSLGRAVGARPEIDAFVWRCDRRAVQKVTYRGADLEIDSYFGPIPGIRHTPLLSRVRAPQFRELSPFVLARKLTFPPRRLMSPLAAQPPPPHLEAYRIHCNDPQGAALFDHSQRLLDAALPDMIVGGEGELTVCIAGFPTGPRQLHAMCELAAQLSRAAPPGLGPYR